MLTVLDKNTEVVLAYLEKAKNVCVSEKINGEYILTFWLPRSDPKWQYIETENYVRCEGQLFIIRTTEEERDASGRLTANVQCEHVYTELIDEYQDQLLNFAGTSAEFALTQILQGTRFTIGTVDDFGLNDLFDLGETNKLDCTEQVKDTWGGEFKWDNRECNLLTERGADNGVQFRYAKNLKSIKRTVDSKNLITRLYGYGRDGLTIEGLDTSAWTQDEKDRLLVGVTVDGSGIITSKYIDSKYINNYPIPKCGKKEINDISDQKTLLEKMQDYMTANEVPKVTYEVDFIELKKLGYKFEDVALGDTVTAIDEPLQANIKARIYEYEYYPYEAERSKVRLANFRENITDLLGEFQDSKDLVDRWKSSTGKVSSSMLEGAINVLINQLIASGAYASAQVVDGKGCLFENTKIDSPDYGALYIGPGIFAIADEKVDGNWNWRTFGKGSGFTADQLIAGKILTSLVRIEGSTHFYWDGDTLYCIDPADPNRQIRINKDGIKYTIDGGVTINNALDYDGLHVGTQPGTTYGLDNDTAALFHYDTHLKSTRGIAPVGTPVATLRPGEGRFGGAVAVEEGTTNKLLQSQNFADAVWTKTGSPVITSNSTKAPDGTITADIIEDDNNAGYEYITQTATCGDSETWTASLYIKKDENISRFPELQLYFSGVTTIYYLAQLNTKTGETIVRAGYETPTVEVKDIGDYWRLCITGTNSVTGNTTVGFRLHPALTSVWGGVESTVTGSCIIWGAQLEKKSFATSYVQTTTTEVTRDNGLLQYSKSVLNLAEGTIYGFFKMSNVDSTNYQALLTIGSTSPRFLIMKNMTTNALRIWEHDGTSEIEIGDATVLTTDNWYSFAYTWGPAGRALYLNGELVATNPKTGPIGFSYADGNIQIGTWLNGSFLNGLIDELRIDTVQRTAEEIKAWHESGVPFVDEGQTQIADNTIVTAEGLKVLHNDGSYSTFTWEGPMRVIAGENKPYFYLWDYQQLEHPDPKNYTWTDSYDGSWSDPAGWYLWSKEECDQKLPPVTVQLPAAFVGKQFKVFPTGRVGYQTQLALEYMFFTATNMGWYDLWYDYRACVIEVIPDSYDYENATFQVRAYVHVKFDGNSSSGSKRRQYLISIDFDVLVTY